MCFFFKQKTAYEMRISDWSSDVCSSDLAPTTTYAATIYADIVLADGGAIPIDAEADERAIYVAEGDASLDGLPLDPMTLYALRPGVAAKIGRASCRESVCQYV